MKSLNFKSIRNIAMSLALIATAGGAMLTLAAPQIAFAAGDGGFLGFPSWYRGLPTGSDGGIASPSGDGLSGYVWTIALNVVDMMLVAVGYLSGFMILYGGWLFIFSQGNPEGIARGRTTIFMAIIGLVLAIASVAIITYVVGNITK